MIGAVEGAGEESRRDFWVGYQPGFRASHELVGSPEFFHAVELERYRLEPDIQEMGAFSQWRGRDVLEAGCGIATDGVQFARAGARYTAIDFSATGLGLARKRFEMEGLPGTFVEGTITSLPFPPESFDLVYSMGVVHHVPETDDVIGEFHRVLRPGGRAIVMIYHRDSFNYRVTILAVRRALAGLVLVPGAARVLARLTGEPPEVLLGHRRLLGEHGLTYLRDRQLFTNHNTDGPGNPLSKVYSRADARRLFNRFDEVRTTVRSLHLRSYPRGTQLAATRVGQRLGDRWGWHLWIDARKAGAP
jgi:SAM-dependent methyltransferase